MEGGDKDTANRFSLQIKSLSSSPQHKQNSLSSSNLHNQNQSHKQISIAAAAATVIAEENSGKTMAGGGGGGGEGRRRKRRKTGMSVLMLIIFLLWCAGLMLISVSVLRPPIHLSWPKPDCCRLSRISVPNSATHNDDSIVVNSPPLLPPRRLYKSNGYLMLSCNGGLNQMRAAICDMVTIARHLNLTLVVPELDKRSFWADDSNFEDIFNVGHFISSLRDEVKIIKKLPKKLARLTPYSMQPISWSGEKYYLGKILPLMKKHRVVHFVKTDNRLANNGLPLELQKLRCRVNYDALRFNSKIEMLGEKIISILRRRGYFMVLHLRYEKDMLAFSGCTQGCSEDEIDELTELRYKVSWWKEKNITSEKKRMEGLCPLTPEETTLVLKALGFESNTTIYIAAGEIYGGEMRLSELMSAFPNTVKKEKLLGSDELGTMLNHSNQMAALDYMVSVASDVFIPTYDGNMAKVVEGHRRYNNFQKSIILERKELVELLNIYQEEKISWDQFSSAVRYAHKNLMGQPKERKVIPGQPKLEDYFYSNPQECLSSSRM